MFGREINHKELSGGYVSRIFTFNSPLGDDLMFRRLEGVEGLSILFELKVILLSEKDSIKGKDLLGKSVTIEMETEGEPRYLNAQVVNFKKTSQEDRFTEYMAELSPWLWYATRTADCRIFQHKTAVQIIDEVLGKYKFPFEKRLYEKYKEIGYYVQYNETDFQFLSRLFEQEGIYYFFEHDDDVHTLILADCPSSHTTLSNNAEIRFSSADTTGAAGEEVIRDWKLSESVKSGRYVTDDYDFKKPQAKLQQRRNDPREHDQAGYEIYNWGQGFSDPGHGEHLTKVELESLQHCQLCATATTTVRDVTPGYTFSLYRHPDDEQNADYLIIRTKYNFKENSYATGDLADHTEWSTECVVQKASLQYRPLKTIPWPWVGGPQTAVVSGPKGEEIWTDKYGRVKVQFPWDRYGKNDENSSCWIRVSSPWAGSNFGAMHVPRIGQEVLIEYINGEINRPIIIGRVYNDSQMPPWKLPDHATQSGILSRSSKGGGYGNANAIRFEDKKGAEQFWIQAERDLDMQVEHDETHHVMHDRKQKIDHDESVTVGNNKIILVHGSHQETIEKGMSINVTGGNQTSTVEGNITVISNNGVIKFMVGASSIIMTKDHIIIDSPRVDLNPGGISGEKGAALATPGAIAAVASTFDASSGGAKANNPLAEPTSAPPAPADKKGKAPVKTGLDDEVNKIAAKSPSLQKDLDKLQKDGWDVKYGPVGEGSFVNKKAKQIVIDGAKKATPLLAVRSLAHESGHALYNYTPDYSSKAAYVNGALEDEGAATLNNIRIQREIVANGGDNMGISGNSANHEIYNKAYDQMLKDGNADAARKAIAKQFGAGETSSVKVDGKSLNYNDYYGGWYDKSFPAKK